MDANRIRELTVEEIDGEIERASTELFNLKYRASYEELESTALLRELRKTVARLKTIRHEKEREAAGKSDA
ncbi:MAG: 50S ribosomal protein L29 [Gemmatimonadota bacterium]|nr:50S ribosomal protein L29 [Gemmatimonadota bacterium]